MLVVSFSISGMSFILSIWMNDKGDVIGWFSFFLSYRCGVYFQCIPFFPFDAGPHCDAVVSSHNSADPQLLSVRVRNIRLIPSLEYDSSIASFSFHPDVKKTKQKKRQPPGHSALRFGGPPLTG